MEKYSEVMRQTIELSDTCLEGMEHIFFQLRDGYMEGTIAILGDVIQAIFQLDQSVQLFGEVLPPKEVKPLSQSSQLIYNDLNHIVEAYEQGVSGQALDVLEFRLLPNYKKWKNSLEKCLHSYVVN